jgi:alpha-tubulin suppressor-like RCC1 family protein
VQNLVCDSSRPGSKINRSKSKEPIIRSSDNSPDGVEREVSNILNLNEKVVEIQCGGIFSMVKTNQGRVFSCGHGISFALGHGS